MGVPGSPLCLITATHPPDPIFPGSICRLTAVITSLGSPISPMNVQVSVLPTGYVSPLVFNPVNDGGGDYHTDFVIAGGPIGTYLVKWVSTDQLNGIGQGYTNNFAVTVDSFDVAPLPF